MARCRVGIGLICASHFPNHKQKSGFSTYLSPWEVLAGFSEALWRRPVQDFLCWGPPDFLNWGPPAGRFLRIDDLRRTVGS
jgi:hypothetical protein